MAGCFICEKHEGTITTDGVVIFEDDLLYVGHIDRQGEPNYKGHLMIDLKRHVRSLADMTIEEAQAWGVMMMQLSQALTDVTGADHIYALVSGNSVPHLHMHVVARYPGTPRAYWGPMDVYDWEDAPFVQRDELIRFCHDVTTALAYRRGEVS